MYTYCFVVVYYGRNVGGGWRTVVDEWRTTWKYVFWESRRQTDDYRNETESKKAAEQIINSVVYCYLLAT